MAKKITMNKKELFLSLFIVLISIAVYAANSTSSKQYNIVDFGAVIKIKC